MMDQSFTKSIPEVRHKLGLLCSNCDVTSNVPLKMARVSSRIASSHLDTSNASCPTSDEERALTLNPKKGFNINNQHIS